VRLILAGHTHGGQVCLPIIGCPVIPSSYGQKYAYGHVRENNVDMFITTGIGTSILPVRFNVPPEIAVLKIYAE
jgi:predicted MPP superfamily phosphohydrolase